MSEINWEHWKNYLFQEYNQRMNMIENASMGFIKSQKGFSVIFLLTKKLDMSLDGVFSEIIKSVSSVSIAKNDDILLFDKNQNGDISMMGHKFGMFGMIESIDNLYKYFIEVYQLLKPEGQILLTSINTKNISSSPNNYSENNKMKFQSNNLFGPYFGIFLIDFVFLQNQAEKTDWYVKLINKQEEGYSVLFSYKF